MFFAVVILWTAQASHVAAIDLTYILHNLPKTYNGSYKWHDDRATQKVSVVVGKVSLEVNGNVLVEGIGEYKNREGDTKVNMKMQISADRRIEIWETNPEDDSTLVTNGSHVGTISQDLRTIYAVWTTKATAKQGILFLSAQ